MQFNSSFGEDEACQLVAIGLGLKQYHCKWITQGQPCGVLVLGEDIPSHLKNVHGANDTPRLVCHWGDCGDELSKSTIVRHVQEKHLEYRWPCPKCGALFTRRGVMDSHRTTCKGTAA